MSSLAEESVLTEAWITEEYEQVYREKKKIRMASKVERIRTYTLKPNRMQKEAAEALRKLRDANEKKALIISATGTGKTYLSVFDVRNYQPRKLLFLVHREQILKQAMESFQDVLGEGIHAGILSGNHHELELLNLILKYRTKLMRYLKRVLQTQYQIPVTEKTVKNLENLMTNEFSAGSGKAVYSDCVFIKKDGEDFKTSDRFEQMLEDQNFYDMVKELVEFGISRNRMNYSNRYMDTNFQLYAKYTYEDVCRLLEWERGEVALNIGGYKYDRNTKTYPVFIHYDKDENIQDSVRYEDRFIDPSTLAAISKSGRSLKSEDVYTALHAGELGVQMELFVRKNKDDKISKEFYYMGKIGNALEAREFVMPNTTKKAVEINDG